MQTSFVKFKSINDRHSIYLFSFIISHSNSLLFFS